MKKFVICFLLVAFCFSTLFAYSYPATLKELLEQYKEEGREINIATNVGVGCSTVIIGKIILVMEDYVLVKKSIYGTVVINMKNIVTID